jgi:hypothetical protein
MQTGNLIHSAMMITWVLLDWSEKCAQHSIIGSWTGLQVLYEDCAMDELLKLVDMNHQLACDIDTGGCGRQNYIHHLLRAAPHVFTTGDNYCWNINLLVFSRLVLFLNILSLFSVCGLRD